MSDELKSKIESDAEHVLAPVERISLLEDHVKQAGRELQDEQTKQADDRKQTIQASQNLEDFLANCMSRHAMDNKTPEELRALLMEIIKAYHPSDDLTLIEKAYDTAAKMHAEQKRRSGDPYIIHPLSVAIILASLQLDKETIAAGLLHDVVEDTPYTDEDMRREFGDEVASLVDGVTKLEKVSIGNDKVERQAENLRKMFLAMAKDIRVILIKLADRLNNMRTLQYMSEAKQKEIARETMEIYSPIAHRLGISKIKIELDDLSLKYLEPEVYYDLVEKIALRRNEREDYVKGIVEEVAKHIADAGIKATVDGRVKHFFSIYKKMKNQNKSLDEIYDLFAVRILVDSVKDCYAALGVIHGLYNPIPSRIKDYIAMPKPNMYQSLHTTLISNTGRPFEIQIRTYEMHRTAEYGIAAHWKYKEAQSGVKTEAGEEAKLGWLREILEWQKEETDNKQFMNLVKSDLDLFSDTVFCFTPTGDVKNLRKGSTPIDFAYAVHSNVGNTMVGCRINEKIMPIDTELQNGDRVEIICSPNSHGPSRDWLSIVKSTQAKNKINMWFKQQFKEENIVRGRELVQQYIKSKGWTASDLVRPEFIDKVLAKYGFRDWDPVLAAIGHGGLKEGQVVNRLAEELEKKRKREMTDAQVLESISETAKERVIPQSSRHKGGILVKGREDLAVRFSKCCSPVPGDDIVGFVTRGRGISVHRADCVNIVNLPEAEKSRLIEASWQAGDEKSGETYVTEIVIYMYNRLGLMVDISKVFTEEEIDILSMISRVNKQGIVTIIMSFEIGGKAELKHLFDKLHNVTGVIDVERTKG